MTQRLGEECWWCIRLKEGTNDWRRGRLLAWSLDTADLDAPGHSGTHPVGIVEDLDTGTVHSLPVDLIRFCEDQPEEGEMAEEAKSIIQEYVDMMGVSSLAGLLANIRKELGSDIPVSVQAAFTTAWKEMHDNGDIPAIEVDRSNPAAITRFARQIQRELVESDITETEKVIDAVHESLVEILPGITRREAMDALIASYTPPSEDQPVELDPVTQRMGALDSPPDAHKWAEVVHGDRKRFKEAPENSVRIQQWEKARAAVTGVDTPYVQGEAVPNESEVEAFFAQERARRKAEKSGVKPPITPATQEPVPTEPTASDSQQTPPATQGEVDWNAIATAGKELLPSKAKAGSWSDEYLAAMNGHMERLAKSATQGDEESRNALIAIAKELEAEKSTATAPQDQNRDSLPRR